MILIDSRQLMAPGDVFEIFYSDWDRIISPPMGPYAVDKSQRKIPCKVLRMFLRSSYEVRYVCVSMEDKRQTEFVLGQFLENAYQVSVTHPTLKVSALVIVEAAAKAGVRSISPERPTLYTREDADNLAKAINDLPVKERYGCLVPDFV